MKITYNAPFVLTFTFIAAGVRLLGDYFTREYFAVPGHQTMDFTAPLNYLRLFTHVLGHGSWEHYIGNFSFILVIGPILEEKYGTQNILFMSLVTALVTGLLNAIFFPQGLLGASGIVFMMILLASFTNMRRGIIPLTFVLVLVVYLGSELIKIFDNNNISEAAHIIGGLVGSIFGFWTPQQKQPLSGANTIIQ